jgi:LuxR family maltose regulon positive regulatory protein
MEAFIRHVGGDVVRAERLVQRVPPGNARTLMWARVTLHRQANAVRRSLASIESEQPRVAIEKQVLLAMIAMKRGHALAEGHLTRAADLAATSGFMLALLGCPPDLLQLAESLAQRTSHDSLAHLVTAARHAEPAVAGTAPARAPLSAGELRLITFLPRRDSNADIARQLGVSVNTVKTRLYRLYRKLGVESRDEAITAARARGLIS